MTFYNQQVQAITKSCLPQPEVTSRIIKAKRLMDNCCNEDIDLDYLAQAAYLSKYHFVRLFKRCYGVTPHQYLTSAKIKKAKILLNQGLSVRATCLALNFSSIPSFTALFKKQAGQTPSAFLQKRNFQ
ncbi:helix-turn-helix domain-containing protein [Mucilaginibacter lacusdianchii]|uniref:helix-turn-helix domain-containing protein n=1 Tax=Mucilaginibacter lacusdianchii TaxID=2684211 RepID=UPI00131A64CF|nr:AraC family transcriptional regulator [Mucilaginibacter sp. JXJ CY 39]